MTILTLSQVAKQFKVNRSTIYRAVNAGKLSRRADGSFDIAEVLRCFGEPSSQKASTSQQAIALPQQDKTEELERLRREFSDYKRQAQDREDWLKNQVDRMQTLLELKTSSVASETSQQHVPETQCDISNATPETIDKKELLEDETLHEPVVHRTEATHHSVPDVAVQQPKKKRGLLGRLVRAAFED